MPPVEVGGGLPPVEVEELVLLEVEDEVEELVDELVELLVEVLELVETLPLEEVLELVDTLPLDEEVVETLPEEVELDVAPLLVLVEPPLVLELVDAVKMALPLEPPKKPPLKKPPPKPPPNPPLPPTTTAGALPLDENISPGGSGGIGIGAAGYVTVRVVVVVVGCRTTHSVRRTRRTCLDRAEAWRTGGALALLDFRIAGRSGGFSATWTAPPPTMAPPTVQAQSLAKAILTDIATHPVLASERLRVDEVKYPPVASAYAHQMQRIGFGASALTMMLPQTARKTGVWRAIVPIVDIGRRGVNETEVPRQPCFRRAAGDFPRFAPPPQESGSGGEGDKNVTVDEIRRTGFDRDLSDLCSTFSMRIGALGQAPTTRATRGRA